MTMIQLAFLEVFAKKRSINFILLLAVFFALISEAAEGFDQSKFTAMGDRVNQATPYPVVTAKIPLRCEVDLAASLGLIHQNIFGTNLEWFNDGGGLASQNLTLRKKITEYTKAQGVTVMRYPGGTLSDFYDWRDGIGPIGSRPKRKHPTDSGSSFNNFGSPEFFKFLKDTDAEGLVTVNVGTGTAQSAAEWVAYVNQPSHRLRAQDGFPDPMNIKLWEIGNELYLPGNPGEQKITLTPEVYADKYLEFSRAIKAVDPSVTTVAIGVAKSHIGPDTEYPNWTKVLLEKAGKEIDMIAVHNAYFPMLYHERHPNVKDVYPALMASPEAVNKSLDDLEKLIKQYEGERKIGIAITEWGGLFSLPNMDNYWVDHVKTMGTGIYIARMLQVMMSHPRVELANYFKLTDRSFMGWLNYNGDPKVPFWVFALYANHHGDQRLAVDMVSPTYHTPVIGIIASQNHVPEVTVVASQDVKNKQVFVNFVNRSLTTQYSIDLHFIHGKVSQNAKLLRIQTKELTAHNGRDIPPEWTYKAEYEPYTTAAPNSINIQESDWNAKQTLEIAPFSVMTLVFSRQ